MLFLQEYLTSYKKRMWYSWNNMLKEWKYLRALSCQIRIILQSRINSQPFSEIIEIILWIQTNCVSNQKFRHRNRLPYLSVPKTPSLWLVNYALWCVRFWGVWITKTEIKLLNEYYLWKEVKINASRCYLKGNVFLENKLLIKEKLAELIFSLICKMSRTRKKQPEIFLRN